MGVKIATTNLSNAYNSRSLLILENKPQMLWWIKTFSIPDITISQEDLEVMHTSIKLEGTKVEYGPLSVTCFIDENYNVYREAYTWLLGKVELDSSDGTISRYITKPSYKTTASVVIFDNSLRSQIIKFLIRGIQITSIDGGEITTQGTEERTISMTFVYDSFELLDSTNTIVTE